MNYNALVAAINSVFFVNYFGLYGTQCAWQIAYVGDFHVESSVNAMVVGGGEVKHGYRIIYLSDTFIPLYAPVKAYSTSGIEASQVGLKQGGTFYAGSGERVVIESSYYYDAGLIGYNFSSGDITVESGDEIVSVYPNPSNGVVKVAVYDEVTVYGITVYGITGNVLFNTNNINELETTLNALGSGVYTIRVNSELGSQTMKVVICK